MEDDCLVKLGLETLEPMKRISWTKPTYASSVSCRRTGGSLSPSSGAGSASRRPAVAERVQRLERAGAIKGYHAELDPAALGFPVAAVVRIRPSPGQLQRIPEIARETEEVGECSRITGEDCYLLRLHLRSIDDLEEILDRFTPHGLTTTSIVHSTPVPRRGPPLEPLQQP